MSVSRFSAYSESNWGKSSLWPCSNPAMRRDLSTIETCRQEEKDLGFGAPATSGNLLRRRVTGQLIGALALALLVLASISTDTSLANKRIVENSPELSVSGGVSPSLLPRVKPVPVTVKVGFTIEGGGSPELDSIALEISRTVTFQTSGLPSCQLAKLYSTAPSVDQICPGSLVGHGRVVSQVTLPGREPTTINGRLLAFYTSAEGRPGILALVKSRGPCPSTT